MPRMHRGDTQITRVHRGSTLITRIHRGSDLVYSPGEFMFAYSIGGGSWPDDNDDDRVYTMCLMDPTRPGDARSIYDFHIPNVHWRILTGTPGQSILLLQFRKAYNRWHKHI